MRNTIHRVAWRSLVPFTWFIVSASLLGQTDATGPYNGSDAGGMRYLLLTQINPRNVSELQAAWVFHTGDVSDGAAPLVSQTTAATGQASLPSAGQLVSLDLVVRDKHNKPILDLKPEQVTVTDNGKPATLTDLRLVNGTQQNEPLISLLFDRPGMEDTQRKSEDSVFGTSASAARETSRKLRQLASKFLNASPDSGLQFAVVDVWGRLQIQQDYSANHKAIAAAVSLAVQPEVYGHMVEANAVERRVAQMAKTGQDSSGAVASPRQRALAHAMYRALQTSGRIARDQHLSPSQACLLALVEAQQSLPGRKVIVYFTSMKGSAASYQRSDTDSHSRDAWKSIIGAANRAGVNIYVVLPEEQKDIDPIFFMSSGGLARGPGPQSQAAVLAALTSGAAATIAQNLIAVAAATAASKSVLSGQEEMNMLAKQTGGEVLQGRGRMSGPVKNLVRSLTTYYEASFVPPSGLQDGTFHTTALQTSRREARMRATTGYLAMPPSAGITDPPQPFEVPLMALLNRQQLPADVDFRARVMQMEHADESNIALLALEVPLSGLQVRTDTSTRLNSSHVSVLATIRDSAGTEIERFSEDIVRRWPAGGSAGTAPAFIPFERSFAAPVGTYVLETAILDHNSGKAAAKRQTFEAFASRSIPELSDLMVVSGIESADSTSTETDLLWHGERRVLPNLYGELPLGTHKMSVFFLAHTDPRSQAPATVKLEVLHDGAPLKGEPLTSTLKPGNEFSPMLTTFSITSAADGKYQVRATLIQGEKSAEKTDEFVLSREGEQTAGGVGTPASDAPVAVDPPQLAAAEQATDRPTQEELDQVLADARKNALDYADALPNLICRQTTQELYDATGKEDWTLGDTIVEVLTYVNHKETRTLVDEKPTQQMANIGSNMSSSGEFGAALTNIFKPESKAKFTWRETGTLRGEPTEVFEYRVEQENSPLQLNAYPVAVANVGYHGRIYIERATRGVKSLTIITDEQSKKFPIRKAAIRVDYDYVAINDHDYLLPVSAQVVTKVGGIIQDALKRNNLTFSNFRRFGSTVRLLETEPQ
jgi:VWFA-related protein